MQVFDNQHVLTVRQKGQVCQQAPALYTQSAPDSLSDCTQQLQLSVSGKSLQKQTSLNLFTSTSLKCK